MTTQPTQTHHEEAYSSLMRGLKELDLCGPCVPCDLVLIGDHAFPLVMNSRGQVLMAASLYGRGRIVVLGHEDYLTTFPALVENALTWLRGDGSENLSVGVHKNIRGVADNLSRSSFQAEVVEAFSVNLEGGVYVMDAYSVDADAKDLVAFLKAGGGVLIGGQAWNWSANNPKENTFYQFPGNKVSGVAGIYFSKHQGDVECLPVYPQIPSSWMALGPGKDFEDDLEFLLQEISEFDLQNGVVASEVLVHGPLAFPIGTTEDGRAFLAGTCYGRGRVVVITHEGLLRRETLAPFWNNAIHWLDKGRNGVVGVVPELNQAFNLFSKSKLNCEKTNFRKDLSVFVCTAYRDNYVQEIQDFVAEGGGLLIGGHAWYWAQTHRGQNPMTDFSGNKILNKMGLSLLKNIIGEGNYKAPVPSQAIKDTYHFRHILRRFAGHVTQSEEFTKHEEVWLKKLDKDISNYLRMEVHDYSYKQMVSGLIDILKLSMPQIQIGCQSDRLNAAELKRAPCVHERFPVTTEKMQVWNLWGGLIYLVAPPKTQVEGVEVTVQMAVPAPYYKSGVTTAADWLSLRTAPSPWAELEFESIILTLPSDVVRDLDHPDELAAHWDDIMRGIADLAAIPHKFPRKERFVTDVQISHGWMHAGYPIMAHTPTAALLVSIDHARTKGLWGPIHELGHNQQRGCWEFPPNTTECTCNLWSVYVHEEVLGITRAKADPSLTPIKRKTQAERYVNGGRKLSSWKVFVALETYLQLQEKFGWDAFKKVFAAYYKMSDFPTDNKGKMNLFAETFSQTVGMNLCGFFKAWGWPIETDTEAKLSNLLPWSDHPMIQYD
ncbi:hypothetical protein PAMA_020778 [Pampus argenteus]